MKYIGRPELARRQKLFHLVVVIFVTGAGTSMVVAAFEFGFGIAPAGSTLAVAGAYVTLAGLIYLHAMIRYTR